MWKTESIRPGVGSLVDGCEWMAVSGRMGSASWVNDWEWTTGYTAGSGQLLVWMAGSGRLIVNSYE